MVKDCLSHTQNCSICATSFAQRITWHISEQKEAKDKRQKQKHILLAVPKSIYKYLVVLDCNWTHCTVKLKSALLEHNCVFIVDTSAFREH
jgi:hypothetical protein